MSDYQREAILRCTRCKHEWKVHMYPGQQYPCPDCEGFKTLHS